MTIFYLALDKLLRKHSHLKESTRSAVSGGSALLIVLLWLGVSFFSLEWENAIASVLFIVAAWPLLFVATLYVLHKAKGKYSIWRIIFGIGAFILFSFILFFLLQTLLEPLGDPLLPERCEMQNGIYCKEHLVSTTATGNIGRITLTIENGRGADIKVSQIIANCTSSSTADCSWSPGSGGDMLIPDGKTAKFILNRSGCPIESVYRGTNTKLKWDLAIKWYSTSEFTHTAKGQLMAQVE